MSLLCHSCIHFSVLNDRTRFTMRGAQERLSCVSSKGAELFRGGLRTVFSHQSKQRTQDDRNVLYDRGSIEKRRLCVKKKSSSILCERRSCRMEPDSWKGLLEKRNKHRRPARRLTLPVPDRPSSGLPASCPFPGSRWFPHKRGPPGRRSCVPPCGRATQVAPEAPRDAVPA
jgi:hypothetical protein